MSPELEHISLSYPVRVLGLEHYFRFEVTCHPWPWHWWQPCAVIRGFDTSAKCNAAPESVDQPYAIRRQFRESQFPRTWKLGKLALAWKIVVSLIQSEFLVSKRTFDQKLSASQAKWSVEKRMMDLSQLALTSNNEDSYIQQKTSFERQKINQNDGKKQNQ